MTLRAVQISPMRSAKQTKRVPIDVKPPRMVPLHLAVDKFATKRALESLKPPAQMKIFHQGTTSEEALKGVNTYARLAGESRTAASFVSVGR